MIRVHHLNSSRSQRILWLLEELELPYEIVFYRRDTKTLRAPPTLRAAHPLGKAPVIEDGDLVLSESGAIAEYLSATYGPHLMRSPGDDNYWRYRQWMHYAEGSLMGQLLLKLISDKLGLLAVPVRKMVKQQLSLHLDYLDAEAAKSSWISGDHFSLADVMLSYPLEAAVERAGLSSSRPHIWSLLQQMRRRPAYVRALSRGTEIPLSGA